MHPEGYNPASHAHHEGVAPSYDPRSLVERFAQLDPSVQQVVDGVLNMRGLSSEQLRSERVLGTFDEGELLMLAKAMAALHEAKDKRAAEEAAEDIVDVFEAPLH